MLEKEAKRQGYSLSSLMKTEWLEPIFKRYKLQSTDDLYASIGYGGLTMNQVLMRLIEEYRKEHKITAAEESEGEQAHKKPRSTLNPKQT